MAYKAITIAGQNVLADDDGAIYQALFGGNYILNIGNHLQATATSSNNVRISDGILLFQGRLLRIEHGDFVDVVLDSGRNGEDRKDFIVAHIDKSGGKEIYDIRVKKGTPGLNPTDPTYSSGRLYEGGVIAEIPLYRVNFKGITIASVDTMLYERQTYNILRGTKAPASGFGADGDIYIKY